MKPTLFTILFVLTLLTTNAQNVMTFQVAEKTGLSIKKLDSLYQSALNSDSTKAVFRKQQDEFIKGYQKTLKDLNNYLHGHQFNWGKETRCFNRIYFNKDGHIDYFLYNFGKDELSIEKQLQFEALLNEFIKTYRFPLSAPVKFAQCSPTRYND